MLFTAEIFDISRKEFVSYDCKYVLAIYTWCRKKNADFFFLQETHSKKEVESLWIYVYEE